MKKFTVISSVVLSVICWMFTYSYAETYYKASKQYEMCIHNESLSINERMNCCDVENKRILTSIANDLRQFEKIDSIPQEIRNNLITHVNNWFKYEKSLIQIELITAQNIGGMYQVIGTLDAQVQRTLRMHDWVTDTIEEISSMYCDSSDAE